MSYRTTVNRTVFSRRLRAAREEARLTRAQLAAQLGVTEPAISRWEAGLRAPRDPFKIADALGVDPYWLTGQKKVVVKRATNGTEPK